MTMRAAAQELLDELQSGWLLVEKLPHEVGWVRRVLGENAEWYQRFCREYLSRCRSHRHRSGRKPDTLIKRQDTIRVLEALARGEEVRSVYVERLLPYLKERVEFKVCGGEGL